MACRRRGAGTGAKRRSVRRRRLLLARGASNPPELTTRPARRPDQGTGAPRRQAISAVRSSRALNGVFKKPVRHRLANSVPGILRRTFFFAGPPASHVRQNGGDVSQLTESGRIPRPEKATTSGVPYNNNDSETRTCNSANSPTLGSDTSPLQAVTCGAARLR